MTSFETERTINVSQDAHSSPTSFPEATQLVHVGNTVEIVEDSVKDIPEAYRGRAVQPPQSAQDDQEDELYSLSPQAKASSAKRRTAESQAEYPGTSHVKPTNHKNEPHEDHVDLLNKRTAPRLTAVDELLAHGAAVCEPGRMKNRQSLMHSDGTVPSYLRQGLLLTGAQMNRTSCKSMTVGLVHPLAHPSSLTGSQQTKRREEDQISYRLQASPRAILP